jgi:ureidoglycolate amidohydrolase
VKRPGSRVLSGSLSLDGLHELKDESGQSVPGVSLEAGFAAPLEGVQLPDAYYSSFVELHIEQGDVLEREQVSLGVVTAIAAPAAVRVHIEGKAGHSGTTLMPERRDALCAASEIILGVEAFAKSSGSINTVAAASFCEIYPNTPGAIPSKVTLEIDVRDVDLNRRDSVLRSIIQGVGQVCMRREVQYNLQILHIDPPAKAGSEVLKAMVAACSEGGVRFKPIVSRDYHDALFMARIAPTAMLFIPCREGVSGRPDEYAAPEDIAKGVYILAITLAKLAGDTAVLAPRPVRADPLLLGD